MKIMILGHARHGKDTVCNLLHDMYGLSFTSSSYFVAAKAVRPWLVAKGITYSSFEDMYADRVNHRADWFDAIADYNKQDAGRLGRELFAVHDIYAGIRNPVEFDALKRDGIFDVCFWVDASKRVEPEPETSNRMTTEHADYIIYNNGPEKYLRSEVRGAYQWAVEHVAGKQKQ